MFNFKYIKFDISLVIVITESNTHNYIKITFRNKGPECAKGSVFLTRLKMKEKCEICDALFIEKNCYNWFFLLFID